MSKNILFQAILIYGPIVDSRAETRDWLPRSFYRKARKTDMLFKTLQLRDFRILKILI